MYLDNLSIAGIIVVALYALVPLLFGRETLKVDESRSRPYRLPKAEPARPTPVGLGCRGEPCPGL